MKLVHQLNKRLVWTNVLFVQDVFDPHCSICGSWHSNSLDVLIRINAVLDRTHRAVTSHSLSETSENFSAGMERSHAYGTLLKDAPLITHLDVWSSFFIQSKCEKDPEKGMILHLILHHCSRRTGIFRALFRVPISPRREVFPLFTVTSLSEQVHSGCYFRDRAVQLLRDAEKLRLWIWP